MNAIPTRRFLPVLVAALLCAAALLSGGAAAEGGGKVACGKPFPPFDPEVLIGGHATSLVVPEGTICVLAGTVVDGNVFVAADAGLITDGARIGGNLKCRRCLFLDIVRGTRIGGSLDSDRLLDGLFVHDSEIEKDLVVRRNHEGNFGFEFLRNRIGGDLEFERNLGRTQIERNWVGGDLEADRNTVGPFSISENHVGGTLSCHRNDPEPTGHSNTATTKAGQCSGL